MLLFALVVGTVPIVLIQHVVDPPAVWTFSLLVFHLGSAIGLFYLLKVVRDKLLPTFTKAQRTLVAGAFVVLLFGWLGIRGEGIRWSGSRKRNWRRLGLPRIQVRAIGSVYSSRGCTRGLLPGL